jgi:hypothetical protein
VKASRCRKCNARIIWARSAASDRWMPMDAEPSAKGSFVLMGWDDPPVATKLDTNASDDPLAPIRDRYVCHFATCPNADEFRGTR